VVQCTGHSLLFNIGFGYSMVCSIGNQVAIITKKNE
jgi:hypothetical protein